jgi:hypothetical protein
VNDAVLSAPRRGAFVLAGGGAVGGALAAQLVLSGHAILVLGLAVVFLPVALWVRPRYAPVVIVASALLIEQFPDIAGSRTLAFSAQLPLFHGLGGYRPSDLLLLFMCCIYLHRRGTEAVASAPATTLARAVRWFTAAVLFAVLFGVATHGIARVALTEARPFLYLAMAYLVVATCVITRRDVDAVLWALVVGTGLKAVEGLVIFFSVENQNPRPDAILGHEESLFFALFVLLTLALWLYRVEGRLRTTATWLLPVVLLADLTNHRRVAWLVLPVAVVVAIAVGMRCLPDRRPFLRKLALVFAVLSAAYFPAYWNKTGSLATPARAIHSAFSPDPRDASSNLYRVQEDANLKFNIAMEPPIGRGFGHPIDYALPIVDIRDIDPYIAYIPHNGVWWIFLRLGVQGTVAFWALLGVGIITATRLARVGRGHLGVVGMLLACALPAYALLGYNDQGFFFYRVGFVMGALLGLAEAARRIVENEVATASATSRASVTAESAARPSWSLRSDP